MKSLSPALQAHLDEGTTTLCWCWRLSRADGVALGFTDYDQALSFDGSSFEPESGFAASEIRSNSDLAVDAQDAAGVLSSDRITETDILDGRWDNAGVELWRVNWADPQQRVLMRRGAVGQIRRGRIAFVAEVRSMAHVLSQTVGRTFQASCDATLGDARCGVNLESSAYRGAGSIIDALRDRAFLAAGLGSFSTGWFTGGTISWTSGASAGREVEILAHDRSADGTVEKRAKVGDALRGGISWRCSRAVNSLSRKGYATCQRLPSPICPIHRDLAPTRSRMSSAMAHVS